MEAGAEVTWGYSAKPLRDVDREGVPQPEVPKCDAPGICKCDHDRASHYQGKTDHYGPGWHACTVFRCDCTTYKWEKYR